MNKPKSRLDIIPRLQPQLLLRPLLAPAPAPLVHLLVLLPCLTPPITVQRSRPELILVLLPMFLLHLPNSILSALTALRRFPPPLLKLCLQRFKDPARPLSPRPRPGLLYLLRRLSRPFTPKTLLPLPQRQYRLLSLNMTTSLSRLLPLRQVSLFANQGRLSR